MKNIKLVQNKEGSYTVRTKIPLSAAMGNRFYKADVFLGYLHKETEGRYSDWQYKPAGGGFWKDSCKTREAALSQLLSYVLHQSYLNVLLGKKILKQPKQKIKVERTKRPSPIAAGTLKNIRIKFQPATKTYAIETSAPLWPASTLYNRPALEKYGKAGVLLGFVKRGLGNTWAWMCRPSGSHWRLDGDKTRGAAVESLIKAIVPSFMQRMALEKQKAKAEAKEKAPTPEVAPLADDCPKETDMKLSDRIKYRKAGAFYDFGYSVVSKANGATLGNVKRIKSRRGRVWQFSAHVIAAVPDGHATVVGWTGEYKTRAAATEALLKVNPLPALEPVASPIDPRSPVSGGLGYQYPNGADYIYCKVSNTGGTVYTAAVANPRSLASVVQPTSWNVCLVRKQTGDSCWAYSALGTLNARSFDLTGGTALWSDNKYDTAEAAVRACITTEEKWPGDRRPKGRRAASVENYTLQDTNTERVHAVYQFAHLIGFVMSNSSLDWSYEVAGKDGKLRWVGKHTLLLSAITRLRAAISIMAAAAVMKDKEEAEDKAKAAKAKAAEEELKTKTEVSEVSDIAEGLSPIAAGLDIAQQEWLTKEDAIYELLKYQRTKKQQWKDETPKTLKPPVVAPPETATESKEIEYSYGKTDTAAPQDGMCVYADGKAIGFVRGFQGSDGTCNWQYTLPSTLWVGGYPTKLAAVERLYADYIVAISEKKKTEETEETKASEQKGLSLPEGLPYKFTAVLYKDLLGCKVLTSKALTTSSASRFHNPDISLGCVRFFHWRWTGADAPRATWGFIVGTNRSVSIYEEDTNWTTGYATREEAAEALWKCTVPVWLREQNPLPAADAKTEDEKAAPQKTSAEAKLLWCPQCKQTKRLDGSSFVGIDNQCWDCDRTMVPAVPTLKEGKFPAGSERELQAAILEIDLRRAADAAQKLQYAILETALKASGKHYLCPACGKHLTVPYSQNTSGWFTCSDSGCTGVQMLPVHKEAETGDYVKLELHIADIAWQYFEREKADRNWYLPSYRDVELRINVLLLMALEELDNVVAYNKFQTEVGLKRTPLSKGSNCTRVTGVSIITPGRIKVRLQLSPAALQNLIGLRRHLADFFSPDQKLVDCNTLLILTILAHETTDVSAPLPRHALRKVSKAVDVAAQKSEAYGAAYGADDLKQEGSST